MENPFRRPSPPPPPFRSVPPPLPPLETSRSTVPLQAPVIFVGPPLDFVGPPLDAPPPPPPSPPALKSVPPIADDALAAGNGNRDDDDNDYAGVLALQSPVVRLIHRLGMAGTETRALVMRAFERSRMRQQMRGAVALAQPRPAAPLFRLDQAKVNKYVVSTYKLIGFAVLSVIVLALVSYLGANVFYWFSTSWITPTIIAPTDERVLSLSTQLVQQANARDKVAADLADAERVTKMQEDFLSAAQQALRDELADRKGELSKLRALDRSFASTRAEAASSGRAFSDMSKHRLAAELEAHFIDRETAVTGALQLSQIAQGNLSLGEKEVELYKRRAELTRETEALSAIIGQAGAPTHHSIDVLKILQDVKRAELELYKARDLTATLKRSLARYDGIVKTLRESPFVRAVDGQGTIAFVPYDNLGKVKAGTPLYGCALGPLFCKRVGTVLAVLSGEMSVKHPLHNTLVRGQPVQVQLGDARDAERQVLFAGGRPLLF